MYVYSSQADITKGLRTREITGTPELIYDTQPKEVKKMYVSDSHAVNNGVYALFNVNSQFLQAKPIRQALSLSVNTANVRRQLAAQTVEMNGPVLHSFLNSAVQPREYNVKKARELLDSNGWQIVNGVRKKDDQQLKLSIVAPKNDNYEKIAKHLSDVWQKELHIATEVKIIDSNDVSQSILQNVLLPRNFDILIYEFALGGDPDVYAYWHSSQASSGGLNFSNYNNAIADDALASGRSKVSRRQRVDRYNKFVSVWHQDVPAIPLYQSKIDYIHLSSARSVDPSVTLVSATDRYTDIVYWVVDKTQVYKTP